MTDTSTPAPGVSRRSPAPGRERGDGAPDPRAVPTPHDGGRRQLYGGLRELGVSVEWHDFNPGRAFECSQSSNRGSLELCLNLDGHSSVTWGGRAAEFEASTVVFYMPDGDKLRVWREAGERHRFVAVMFTPAYLRKHLSPCDGALHPLVERFASGCASPGGLGPIHRLTAEQELRVARLLRPPVAQAARRLCYQGQVLQLMAEFLFEREGEDELFCDRQKRLARERADKVIAILGERLADPPGLGDIGKKVGCSPFHLSRTFSREMGMTIQQYLRKLRMERAAELLRSGKYNVTEAALEVGYSSLSHFSQAFCETMGCCPALYPLRPPTMAPAASAARGPGGKGRSIGEL